jgi:phenylalanyl-tRNA synthetase alpha chain
MEILNQTLGDSLVKIGLGPCMKNKWVKKDKNLIVRLSQSVRDETRELLHQIASGIEVSEDDLKNLKKRKLVNQQIRKSYRLEKGEEFSERRQKRCADITLEMLGDIAEVRGEKEIQLISLSFSDGAWSTLV